MNNIPLRSICFLGFLLAASSLNAADLLTKQAWVVEGVTREALVYAPPAATTNATPVVFVFHGHGGSMSQAVRSFHLHTLWPEAIIVYPQGLNTPGRLTDPEGRRAGWQADLGDQNDRDLKLFDAMLVDLGKVYSVDTKRIHATGHSNGGAFTYLLWAARGDRLAAVAPSAAAISMKNFRLLKPKPAMHLAGEKDALVKFAWQERTMDALRRLNQCGAGEPWGDAQGCTLYESKVNTPVLTCIFPGGHSFSPEAPAMIVEFFRACSEPLLPVPGQEAGSGSR